MESYIKDPNDLVDYKWDWAAWLNGDTISASEFIVSDPSLVVDSTGNDSDSAIVKLSGGEAGRSYRVTNRITTLSGLVKDKTIVIRVLNQ